MNAEKLSRTSATHPSPRRYYRRLRVSVRHLKKCPWNILSFATGAAGEGPMLIKLLSTQALLPARSGSFEVLPICFLPVTIADVSGLLLGSWYTKTSNSLFPDISTSSPATHSSAFKIAADLLETVGSSSRKERPRECTEIRHEKMQTRHRDIALFQCIRFQKNSVSAAVEVNVRKPFVEPLWHEFFQRTQRGL